jgi:predicted nucleic acid-binding protein
MMVLIDSNVLLRAAIVDDPHFGTAVDAVALLEETGLRPTIVPQCCYEYFVVATRPAERNGLGLEPAEAMHDISDHQELFRFLRDERTVFETWKELVTSYTVRGKVAHDARLVAAMLRHDIKYLLTFNDGDFRRYVDRITVLNPHEVVAHAQNDELETFLAAE